MYTYTSTGLVLISVLIFKQVHKCILNKSFCNPKYGNSFILSLNSMIGIGFGLLQAPPLEWGV